MKFRKIDSIILLVGFFLLFGLGMAIDDKPKEVSCPQIIVKIPPDTIEPQQEEDDEYREPNGTLMNDQIH